MINIEYTICGEWVFATGEYSVEYAVKFGLECEEMGCEVRFHDSKTGAKISHLRLANMYANVPDLLRV